LTASRAIAVAVYTLTLRSMSQANARNGDRPSRENPRPSLGRTPNAFRVRNAMRSLGR
jgi:hypothetical protein